MTSTPIAHLLRGPFNFLHPSPEEFRRIFPDAVREIPSPYPIFLADETSTPFHGFPVLMTDGLEALREALALYLDAEEEVQLNLIRRRPFSRAQAAASWDRYRSLLSRAIENATLSSYGRFYPEIFWLQHSLDIARRLKESPKRVIRFDLALGKAHGDEIKYRVFERFLDQSRACAFEIVNRLARDREEWEEALIPRLLHRMFDNVLIFSEDHIGADLAELGSYFSGYLHLDGRDFRQRFDRLAAWFSRQVEGDRPLRTMVHSLVPDAGAREGRKLLHHPGLVSVLATLPGYSQDQLLSPEQVRVWEALLLRLKEFELLSSLRSLVLPVRSENGTLVFRAGGLDRTWSGQRIVQLSPATRPLDFFTPSVIDPLVHRYGLIYDVSGFSEVVTHFQRTGSEQQEKAFRHMFRFQQRINRLASNRRLQLEKYLGDGAFYTSRQPAATLICAIHLQRLYERSLREGMPFNRGLRIALNFGHYRLIPIQLGNDGEPERYEFFGQGVVELSRLTSGKSAQEIDEIKNILLAYGYPQEAVERFFAPLAARNLDIVDRDEHSRRYYAYLNRNGSLINEGIVATGEYIRQLATYLLDPLLFRFEEEGRSFVVLELEDQGSVLRAGLRKLGVAHLKGLDDLPVYEIVDASAVPPSQIELLGREPLLAALDRLAAPVGARTPGVGRVSAP